MRESLRRFRRKWTTQMRRNFNTSIWGKFNWNRTWRNSSLRRNSRPGRKTKCPSRLISSISQPISGLMSIASFIRTGTSLLSWSGPRSILQSRVLHTLMNTQGSTSLKGFIWQLQRIFSWQNNKKWKYFRLIVNMKDGRMEMEAMTWWMLSITISMSSGTEDLQGHKYIMSWSIKSRTCLMPRYTCSLKLLLTVYFTLGTLLKLSPKESASDFATWRVCLIKGHLVHH